MLQDLSVVGIDTELGNAGSHDAVHGRVQNERVEVLTGGASSTYGADAVAGVVNFIMIDDFEGVKLDYQFSQYRHDNESNFISREAGESGFPAAGGTANDGDTDDLTFIIGGNLNEGRGNITAYATYRDIEGSSLL